GSGDLLWSSFLGGSGDDYGNAIAADAAGNALIAGETSSSDFPTPGGFDTSYNGGGDAFAAKVSGSGALVWSSFLGGSDRDSASAIAADAAGNALTTGVASSSDFPTPGGFDTSHNGGVYDAFVAKVSGSGALLWASFLGGSSYDRANAIAADAAGNALIAGQTYSSDLPTPGGFDTSLDGGNDGFVAKVSRSGALLWSSFLGGSDREGGRAIAADATGNALIAGSTSSSDFPTPGGFDTSHNGGHDAFVTKIFLPVTVSVGQGGAKAVTYRDVDETVVTVTLKGGAGALEFTGDNLQTAQSKKGVVVTGTNVRIAGIHLLTVSSATSALTVKTKGGDGRATAGALLADGDMKSVAAKTLDFIGNIDIAGTIRKLAVGDIADDHVISIGGSPAAKPVTITMGRVADTVLNCLSPIKALRVIEWLDDNAVADAVNAPVLGKLTVKGAKANAKKGIAFSAGHFQADLNLDGAGAAKATLRSATIAGDLDGADWAITGLTGKLTVRRTARDSTVRSTRSIGGIALGAAQSSDFLAGMKANVTRHGQTAGDYADTAVGIKSFKIAGPKLPKGQAPSRWFFSNSNVSAGWIGAVSLLNVDFDNLGTAFGLWACDSTPGNEIKSVKWSDKLDPTAKGKWPAKDGGLFNHPDLVVEML
ncbi:MAG: SBBP repeat-containing protein, partial [Planctomycetota bacterium]